MKFPETNQIHKKPVPEMLESNAKKLEQHLNKINWSVFGKAYLIVLAYVLLTLFTLIVSVGLAKKFLALI